MIIATELYNNWKIQEYYFKPETPLNIKTYYYNEYDIYLKHLKRRVKEENINKIQIIKREKERNDYKGKNTNNFKHFRKK